MRPLLFKVSFMLLLGGITACKKDDKSPSPQGNLIKTLRIETVGVPSSDAYSSKDSFTYARNGVLEFISKINTNGSIMGVYLFERHDTYSLRRYTIQRYPISTDSFVTDKEGRIQRAFLGLEQNSYGQTCTFKYDEQQQLISFESHYNNGAKYREYTFQWKDGDVVESSGSANLNTQYQYDLNGSMPQADFLNVLSLLEWGQPVISNKHKLLSRQSSSGKPLLTEVQSENGLISSYKTIDNCGRPVRYSFTYY